MFARNFIAWALVGVSLGIVKLERIPR